MTKNNSINHSAFQELSNEDLIKIYHGCEGKGLDEIYRRLYGALYYFFLVRVRDDKESEDLTNDVFVNVMCTKYPLPGSKKKRFDLKKKVSFKTWIFKIALNIFIDFLRKTGKIVTFSEIRRENSEDEITFVEEKVHNKELSPREIMISKEYNKLIQECSDSLLPLECLILELKFATDWEMKLKDIAKELNISVTKAFRVKENALRQMRNCLESKGITNSLK